MKTDGKDDTEEKETGPKVTWATDIKNTGKGGRGQPLGKGKGRRVYPGKGGRGKGYKGHPSQDDYNIRKEQRSAFDGYRGKGGKGGRGGCR